MSENAFLLPLWHGRVRIFQPQVIVDEKYVQILNTVRWLLSDSKVPRSPRCYVPFLDPATDQPYNVAFMLNRVVFALENLGSEKGPELWLRDKSEFKTFMDELPRVRPLNHNWFDCRGVNLDGTIARSTLKRRERTSRRLGLENSSVYQHPSTLPLIDDSANNPFIVNQQEEEPIPVPTADLVPGLISNDANEVLRQRARSMEQKGEVHKKTEDVLSKIFAPSKPDHSKPLDGPPEATPT